jgi:hypothetical protein
MKDVAEAVAKAPIPDDEKVTIVEAIRGGINRTSARERTRDLAKRIKIDIGPSEEAAWQRRNDAAHCTPIPEGEELEAIQDMKLLMGLFHRLLLSITGAADLYVDYATPGHPWRPLRDPVPSKLTSPSSTPSR